jgi:hypothetical protein
VLVAIKFSFAKERKGVELRRPGWDAASCGSVDGGWIDLQRIAAVWHQARSGLHPCGEEVAHRQEDVQMARWNNDAAQDRFAPATSRWQISLIGGCGAEPRCHAVRPNLGPEVDDDGLLAQD